MRIFIVEGDSAGGFGKTARDRNYQAILPIRGKILNVEKANIDKVLCQRRDQDYDQCLGCGFSEATEMILISRSFVAQDRDRIGRCGCGWYILLCFDLVLPFYAELIYEGHVYIAMPPLIR